MLIYHEYFFTKPFHCHTPVRNPSRNWCCFLNGNDQRILGRCCSHCPRLFPKCIPRCWDTPRGSCEKYQRSHCLNIKRYYMYITNHFNYLGDEISRLSPRRAPPHPLLAGSRVNSKSVGSSIATNSIHISLNVLVKLYDWEFPQNFPISGEKGPPFLRGKGIKSLDDISPLKFILTCLNSFVQNL